MNRILALTGALLFAFASAQASAASHSPEVGMSTPELVAVGGAALGAAAGVATLYVSHQELGPVTLALPFLGAAVGGLVASIPLGPTAMLAVPTGALVCALGAAGLGALLGAAIWAIYPGLVLGAFWKPFNSFSGTVRAAALGGALIGGALGALGGAALGSTQAIELSRGIE